MVIMSNTIQAGWNFDSIDSIVDELSVGTNSSYKKNENPRKNDGEMTLANSATQHTGISKDNTDEEGWTTTRPGKKKPKDNNKVASTESIITTIDGNIDQIDAGTSNRIYVTSPGRKNKCNVPDKMEKTIEFSPTINTIATRTTNETGLSKEQGQNTRSEQGNSGEKNNDNDNNSEEIEGGKDNNKKNEERNNMNNGDNNNSNNGRDNRGGRGGQGGRGGRGRREERKQTPRKEWETYEFSISFNPKTMTNKDPDEEFQAVLTQMMTKSPGITFHPTNNDMFPQPEPFTTIQEYPQTEAAFKDFFEVYENKGFTTYRIFIKATMQYNELELRNSLLNYLRSNNLWMSSDLISENVDEMIGHINFGHDKLVWRPECEKKINNGIKSIIQSGSISEALKLKIRSLKKEIHVRVAAGTFRGGPRNDPVMCEGLVLRTTKAQARATIELLGLIDDNILGQFYEIIPRGIDRELGPRLYGDLLRTNNDMLNTLRSVTVVNWPEELFQDHYNPASDVTGTIPLRVDSLLMNSWNCVAIEKTTDTQTRGKYLLIFQEKDMEKAKEYIGDLLEEFGRRGDRPTAQIALERFREFPEFDSIQRVSQSVHSKGLRLREMLETAAAQRTKATPKKANNQKFYFHKDKDLQNELAITTQRSYSNVTAQQIVDKKRIVPTQTPQQKLQSIIRQTQPITPTQTPTTQTQTQTPHDARTLATNNSGLSLDQQTITTMMTQITTQFKDMENERIIREDQQETNRQTREDQQEERRKEREAKAEERREDREARMEEKRLEGEARMEEKRLEGDVRMEEKRLEAQKDMFSFLQTILTNNASKNNRDTTVPEELTTGTTEQTSDITTSIVTAASAQSAKRSSSQLSNQNEETVMKDNEDGKAEQEINEDELVKRNKTSKETKDKDANEEEEENDVMEIDDEQQHNKDNTQETITETDTSSFVGGFNNQQFISKTNTVPKGVSQQ